MTNSMQQHPESPEIFAVIMAGGVGSRLWPLSRKKHPKQFSDFLGDGTMILKTFQRLEGLVKPENILVVTNKQGELLVKESLPDILPENIIAEPIGKNTAPCIALATAYIRKRNPNSVAIILPADHLIQDTLRFQQTLRGAIDVATQKAALVTIGMKPNRPETGYGYIQSEEGDTALAKTIFDAYQVKAFKVKTFAEKPDVETAKGFLKSGDFLWNSGVFIWHIDSISREFERSMPELFKDLEAIYESIGTPEENETIERVYAWTHPISIDYGVMEKAETVYVMEGTFDWSDLGSWDEVLKLRLEAGSLENNADENLLLLDSQNTLVMKPTEKAIAIIGMEDVIVIDTDDALLICKRHRSQDVKQIVDTLKRKNIESYT
ncbi:Mannose-1-phosphate guanylyltransferase (GDP) [Chloroherpeton thalassium ATCC 35110]|uniref:mannose-1-phosphate guanylyltransferase n=1 Tax=Chloroherpeton thalassium (strain ATCC 35110 / GB-78) TaxID=517418 RepID=B3QTS1_CHLT3|nr:mannose-1-phosphate guanylyltransferase [Chloroherpeton thalassium]ACF14269.1 Mannose-1-phosphate guanylyltransferase (GDP) [Chloroherpeton thalassium ATCC 35110]